MGFFFVNPYLNLKDNYLGLHWSHPLKPFLLFEWLIWDEFKTINTLIGCMSQFDAFVCASIFYCVHFCCFNNIGNFGDLNIIWMWLIVSKVYPINSTSIILSNPNSHITTNSQFIEERQVHKACQCDPRKFAAFEIVKIFNLNKPVEWVYVKAIFGNFFFSF